MTHVKKGTDSSVLAEAIRQLGNARLLAAFERDDLSTEARTLIRAELLRRLNDSNRALLGEVKP